MLSIQISIVNKHDRIKILQIKRTRNTLNKNETKIKSQSFYDKFDIERSNQISLITITNKNHCGTLNKEHKRKESYKLANID